MTMSCFYHNSHSQPCGRKEDPWDYKILYYSSVTPSSYRVMLRSSNTNAVDCRLSTIESNVPCYAGLVNIFLHVQNYRGDSHEQENWRLIVSKELSMSLDDDSKTLIILELRGHISSAFFGMIHGQIGFMKHLKIVFYFLAVLDKALTDGHPDLRFIKPRG